jgi:hypothetical protein
MANVEFRGTSELEEELARARQQAREAERQAKEAEKNRKRLEKALKDKKTSDKQREQRLAALAIAGNKRRDRHERKLAGHDTEPNKIRGPPPNEDIGWGLEGIASELNCDIGRAGYLFRSGKLGSAAWKLGARTIAFSRSKLAALSTTP